MNTFYIDKFRKRIHCALSETARGWIQPLHLSSLWRRAVVHSLSFVYCSKYSKGGIWDGTVRLLIFPVASGRLAMPCIQILKPHICEASWYLPFHYCPPITNSFLVQLILTLKYLKYIHFSPFPSTSFFFPSCSCFPYIAIASKLASLLCPLPVAWGIFLNADQVMYSFDLTPPPPTTYSQWFPIAFTIHPKSLTQPIWPCRL